MNDPMTPEEREKEIAALRALGIEVPPNAVLRGFPPVPPALRDPAYWEGFDEWLRESRTEGSREIGGV